MVLRRNESTLKLLRRILFACLQDDTSSFRLHLFKVARLGLQLVKCFSHKHRLHGSEIEIKEEACFMRGLKYIPLMIYRNHATAESQLDCPLNGSCLKSSVIYQATAATNDSKPSQTYIGLKENSFKTRFTNHKNPFNDNKKKPYSLKR